MTASAASPGQHAPVRYAETTDDKYSEDAAQMFEPIQVAKGTLILRGPCPRCRAVIEIPVVNSIFRSSRMLSGRLRGPKAGSSQAAYIEPMLCNCQYEHRDRPDGRSGCGAYWTLTITPDGQ